MTDSITTLRTVNAFSVDVEDYHNLIDRMWFDTDSQPTSAVVDNTQFFLDTLAAHHTTATFFFLGDVANAFPDLIRRTHNAGHEIGVHGYHHLKVHTIDADTFRNEIQRTKSILEDITGQQVIGHRAPAFSITTHMTWALDVLAEVGFTYDSSIYPIKGRRYGDPTASIEPFQIDTKYGPLLEIPPATLTKGNKRQAVCGGGYMRHFSYTRSRNALAQINTQRPAVVYFHPYEIEPLTIIKHDTNWPAKKKLQYWFFSLLQARNRHTMKDKIKRLLDDFAFAPIAQVYQQEVSQLSSST